MGDRTNVRLSLLSKQVGLFKEQLPHHYLEAVDIEVYGEFTKFIYCDINYGELKFLPKLFKLGIAYDSSWEAGDEYGAGTEMGRFTKTGELIRRVVYNSERSLSAEVLMRDIHNPKKLIDYIKQMHQRTSPLSWDNQYEYGQTARCLRLLVNAAT